MAPFAADDFDSIYPCSFSYDEVIVESKSVTSRRSSTKLQEIEIIVPRRGQRVSFGDAPTVHEVINRDSITPEEKEACWFSRFEMQLIKYNVRSDVSDMQSGRFVETDDATARGLESSTRMNSMAKRWKRMNAYEAVFCEIKNQEQDFVFDEDAIADAYFEYTESCQASAVLIAKQDEIEARKQ